MKTGAGEAEKLRREIGGRRSRRGPLPSELRERGKAYARARASAGASAAAIAVELGIAERTAERWLRPQASASLVPIRVIEAPRTGPTWGAVVVVTTPSGLRIEGLDVDAVCTLVARFG